VLLQIGAGLGGYRVVDEVIKKGEKLRAGQFSFLVSPSRASLDFVCRGVFLRRK
jgi:hypothetical protein